MVWGTSMSMPKVAYLGPIASYSHKAVMGYFSAEEFEYVPCTDIKDIFSAVQSGSCLRGVIPYENSINGFVVFTLNLLADHESSYQDIIIYDETYVDVHHYLLGNLPSNQDSTPTISSSSFESSSTDANSGTCTPTQRDPHPVEPRTKPLVDISHIKELRSHPQAFGQCEPFLQKYLKDVNRKYVSSTSQAAQDAKADLSGKIAAISSKIASEVHNVNVLARGIEEDPGNRTRFLIIKNDLEHRGLSRDAKKENGPGGSPTKSLVSFTMDHRSPSTSTDILGAFRRQGLNLAIKSSSPEEMSFHYLYLVEQESSRINDSREENNEGALGQYIYFIELELDSTGIQDLRDKVENALGKVGQTARGWRWFGSWQSRLNRSDVSS